MQDDAKNYLKEVIRTARGSGEGISLIAFDGIGKS